MKKLDKGQRRRIPALVERFAHARQELLKAVEAVNDEIRHYNAVLDDARALRDEVVQAMGARVKQKPVEWRDTAKGRAYRAWQTEWDSLGFYALDEIVEIDTSHGADLAGARYRP